MKNNIILLVVLLISLSGCITSLHPLYTEDTIVINDDLIGKWVDQKTSHATFEISRKALWHFFNEERTVDIYQQYPLETPFPSTQEGVEKLIKEQAEKRHERFEGAPLEDLEYNKATMAEKIENQYYKLKVRGTDAFHSWNNYEDMYMYVTEIDEEYFIDFYPIRKQRSFKLVNYDNKVSTHTFAKLEIGENEICIKKFNTDYLKELIFAKKIRLKHEIIEAEPMSELMKGLEMPRIDNNEIVLTASTEEMRAFIAKYKDDPKMFIECQTFTKKTNS